MDKILLCCGAGMSSSLLVQKMQAEAAARGLDVSISALPLNEAAENLSGVRVVLLGPQIGYGAGDLRSAIADMGLEIPVEVIPMLDYGRMNAAGVLDLACGLGHLA